MAKLLQLHAYTKRVEHVEGVGGQLKIKAFGRKRERDRNGCIIACHRLIHNVIKMSFSSAMKNISPLPHLWLAREKEGRLQESE